MGFRPNLNRANYRSHRIWRQHGPLYREPYQYWCSGDSTDRIQVDVRKPGYVPSIDTFFISSSQPQIIHIKLDHDYGFLSGKLSFIVRDTTGEPVPDAELYATWYPGPSWGSMWYVSVHFDDPWLYHGADFYRGFITKCDICQIQQERVSNHS